ncbi:UDP-glucose 4-epimerase GalE [Candidatus Pacearchaeota archaeon RBG_19FT_COMBO_34_9]|nr:MAG: UDP-glucose 4-epimerase GalE [Candidatus Pacearchaeota archaeon RBG_19FT_COMBO_34_9]OGJ16564.1 MAG: UDP-glucose 4-epimerase GalE [Candidatus Pacearchaeota archaeon RBG_13_33_26]
MKILVTGGAGFIGSHIHRLLLDKGNSVIVYDNLSRGFKQSIDSRAEFILGSLNEKEKLEKALKEVDAVIHLASYIAVGESMENPFSYIENNIIGTAYLLEAMRNTGVKKIIFSSTACVYGNPDELPLTEDSPLKEPTNIYGFTKLTIENLLKFYHKNYRFDAVILRYFNAYGPNELHTPETHIIPNIIRAVLEKQPVPIYWKGEQIRDFIYVKDLASAHLDVLNLKDFHIFNVGTGIPVKINDLLEKIFKIAGYKTKIKDMGERAGDVKATYASSDKINKIVGWKAKTSLEEGLKNTIAFFQRQEK